MREQRQDHHAAEAAGDLCAFVEDLADCFSHLLLRWLGGESNLFDAGFLQAVGHREDVLRRDRRIHAEKNRLVFAREQRLVDALGERLDADLVLAELKPFGAPNVAGIVT